MKKRAIPLLLCIYLSLACSVGTILPFTSTPTPTALPPSPTAAATATRIPSATPVPPPTATPRPTLPPTPTVRPSAPPGLTTLRDLGGYRGVQMGVYYNPQWFTNNIWRKIILREFNLAVVSNGFYWADVEANRSKFTFGIADEQVDFARQNQLDIVGHALLLGRPPYIPNWLAFGKFTKAELEITLRTYINRTMARYKGKISTYIVVEDAPLPPEQARDPFYQAFGDEYIDLAFQIARESDPTAVLIYNAGDNETPSRPAATLTRQIVDRLKTKKLIDGIGFEMHLDASTAPKRAEAAAEMKSYGLPVHITEMDVDLSNLPGTKTEKYEIQARIFGDMLSACLDSGACRSFSLWGIGDKYNWRRRESNTADPTPWDDDLKPKPAFEALLQALRSGQ